MKHKHSLAWLVSSAMAWTILVASCVNVPPADNNGGGTGSVRVLVTDRPYPFDLIEEATITITEVQVRRAEEEGPACDSNADCLDDVFCNGTETCVDGECHNGEFPCADGEFCDEEQEDCLTPCTDDVQCNNAFYCDGEETCDTVSGECLEGDDPCEEDQTCDESLDVCVNTDDDDDDDGVWITIFTGDKTFNLLDLQNGRTDLLANASIPAGTYTQMRLIVTEGTVKLFDVEEPFVLRVPSGEQTGIKLHFLFEVEDGEETLLLLDVDLSRAFRPIPAGQIEDPSTIRTFHFTPSVAMKLIHVLDAGRIAGAVLDGDGEPLPAVSVTAFDEDDNEVTSTSTEDDGTFVLSGLITGTYRVEFSLTGFEDTEVADVEVTAGETTTIDDVTMTAEGP